MTFVYQSNCFYKPDFTDYDFETQGRLKYKWNTSAQGLGDIATFWQRCIGYMDKNEGQEDALKAFEDWIQAYRLELEKTNVVNDNFQGFPWGDNWYQFSVTSTIALAYYILCSKVKVIPSVSAETCIRYIIKDPQHSLGYTRDQTNSAVMLFPWTVAAKVAGTFDATNSGYLYAVEQFNLAPNKNLAANSDGVHIDYSYLTHGGVNAYGYILEIMGYYQDTQQVVEDISDNLVDEVDKIKSILLHKTIPLSGCALWDRQANVGCPLYEGPRVTPACMVMPAMRYIRMFGTDYQWSSKLGQNTVAYYECDKTVQNMGLYSSFCRRRFTESTSPNTNFKTAGFLLHPDSDQLLTVPGSSNTTTKYFCDSAPGEIGNSFVFNDGEDLAIGWQEHLMYPPLLDRVVVNEYIVVNIKNETVNIISSFASEEGNYDYMWGGNRYMLQPNPKSWKSATLNLKTGVQTIESDIVRSPPTLLELTNNKYYNQSILETNGHYHNVIYRVSDNSPYILCPAEGVVLSQIITVNDMNFSFDEYLNQYLFVRE